MTHTVNRERLADGRLVVTEWSSFEQSEEAYAGLLERISSVHSPERVTTHGIGGLVREAPEYFDPSSLPRLSYGYETYDLASEQSYLHWAMTTPSRRLRSPHIAGLLEWLPMSTEETLVSRVYVKQSFRRLGIATLLMQDALRLMKEQGYAVSLAFVTIGDVIASELLASRDFRLVLRAGKDKDALHIRDLETGRLFRRSLKLRAK